MNRLAGLMLFVVIALGTWPRAGLLYAAAVEVPEAAICQKVAERNCVEPASTFPVKAGQVYCWTRVVGATDPLEVVHVWYFGDQERARVTLPVKSETWRTYSSKRIRPHETGAWHVDILGPDAQVLKTVSFEITP